MSIITNVPNNLNRNQTFHTFNYLRQAGQLVNVPQTIALIGTMASTGTGTAGVVYDVFDAATTDALFGQSSELALMCREAMLCSALFQRGPAVKAVAVAEPGGGVANVKTITATGTAATTDGNALVVVAGREFLVGIRAGDVPATVQAAVTTALKARQAEIPVIATGATNVTTLTHPTKGVNGGDVKVTINAQVAGITLTVANTAVGSGVADHQPALDALSPLRYDGIAFANHASADVTEILTDINTRWGAASKTWGWYFIGEPGTIGTATSLAAAANHRAVVVANMEGCLNTAGEIATAAAMLVWSRTKPNAGYAGAKVPLYPPAASVLYTAPEVETAIAAGLTVFNGVVDSIGQLTRNMVRCERLVTTKTTTGGFPDDRNRDIAVSRTGVAIALQLDIATEDRLGADSNPDGVSQDESTDAQIKDLAAAILRAEANAGVISKSHVEENVSAIIVEHDSVTVGRDNVKIPYTVNVPLGQIAWVHDITIGA